MGQKDSVLLLSQYHRSKNKMGQKDSVHLLNQYHKPIKKRARKKLFFC